MTGVRRGLVVPTALTLAGLILLVGLGVWQLERRAWKHALIQRLAERLAAPPRALPPPADWPSLTPAADEFRRVTLRAEFRPGEEAHVYTSGSGLRPDVSGAGYWVLAPARLAGGGTVMINRGFVAEARRDPTTRREAEPRGVIEITGVLRWREERGAFTPSDQPEKNLWFTREPQAIAAAKGWGAVAPFYIEQETPNPGGWPKAARVEPRLTDNHLQYAITWFALAAALLGVFVLWLTRRVALSN